MKLQEIILENERNNALDKNRGLIVQKLIELAHGYPKELTRVLVATGVKISNDLPSKVLYSITLKHLSKNSELREAISRMILELDNYLSADGQTWGLIGGALSAVGSVLSGIGRSQTTTTSEQRLIEERERMQEELEREKVRRRRTTWIIVGFSLVVIVGLILAFKAAKKNQVAEPAPLPKT